VPGEEAKKGTGGGGSEDDDRPLSNIGGEAEREAGESKGGDDNDSPELAVDAFGAPIEEVHNGDDPEKSEEIGEDPEATFLAEEKEMNLGVREIEDVAEGGLPEGDADPGSDGKAGGEELEEETGIGAKVFVAGEEVVVEEANGGKEGGSGENAFEVFIEGEKEEGGKEDGDEDGEAATTGGGTGVNDFGVLVLAGIVEEAEVIGETDDRGGSNEREEGRDNKGIEEQAWHD